MKIKRFVIALTLPAAMLALLLAALGSLPLPVARAATYTVTNNNASGPGSLQQAILDANANSGHDTITFGPSVSGTIVLTATLPPITDTLTISGPGAGNLAVGGGGSYRVFDIAGSTAVTIAGLTVRDGAALEGGGVRSAGALLLDATNVVSNSGGGVYLSGGATLVLGGMIEDNDTGIYVDGSSSGSLVVRDSVISGNLAAGLTYATSSDAFAVTLGGATSEANTFSNNGPGGGVNITVTAPSGRLPVSAFYNDWGVTGLANIEATLNHQFDDPSLARVDYYTLTLDAAPPTQAADGLSPVTLTAALTGTLAQPAGEVISFTTSLGAFSAPTDTTDAAHQASVALTSTTAGAALVTATAAADPLAARPRTASVTFQNVTPVAVDDAAATSEDNPVAISVLDNDGDVNGDPLTVAAVGLPVTGSAVISGSTQVVYTPTNTIASYDAVFTYTASDGSLTDAAAVSVTVTADNDPPTANDDVVQVGENVTSTISVLDNDSDPDSDDTLSIASVGAPVTGTASISGSVVAYTPPPGFQGSDVFTYTVRDLGGLTDTATVTVTVKNFILHLPLAYKNYLPAPDLVVQSFAVASNDAQVVVRNQGNISITAEFWVDVYIDPSPAPSGVNQTWQDLADYGLAWKVTADALPNLGPSGVFTLTMGDDYYRPDWSQFPRDLPAGTPVYVQVDSYSASTNYGAVLEGHELTAGAYNNISGTVSTLGATGSLRSAWYGSPPRSQ